MSIRFFHSFHRLSTGIPLRPLRRPGKTLGTIAPDEVVPPPLDSRAAVVEPSSPGLLVEGLVSGMGRSRSLPVCSLPNEIEMETHVGLGLGGGAGEFGVALAGVDIADIK